MVRALQKGALIVLLILSLLLLLFALLSGSQDYGGGFEGLWKNSPNSLPWLVLLVFVIIAWRNKILGGILITISGAALTYYFNFSGENFFLATFVFCMLILLLGLVVWVTGSYIRSARK